MSKCIDLSATLSLSLMYHLNNDDEDDDGGGPLLRLPVIQTSLDPCHSYKYNISISISISIDDYH